MSGVRRLATVTIREIVESDRAYWVSPLEALWPGRVAIARARRPRPLLCDEPTGNLDEASAAAVAALLLDRRVLNRPVMDSC